MSDEINWPAVGLARWLVRSWQELFHGGAWPRPATCRNARDFAVLMDQALADDFDASDRELDVRDSFVRSHSLRAAAGGASFPDVWLMRDRGLMSVAWHDSMDGEIFFTLSKGEEDVPDVDFAHAVFEFISWVRDCLQESVLRDELADDVALLSGWLERFSSKDAAMEGIVSEAGLGDGRWQRVAHIAGVDDSDPSTLLELGAAELQKGTLASADGSAIALAFRCAAPSVTDAELARIRSAILDVSPDPTAFGRLEQLADSVVQDSQSKHDFVRGYHLARALRRTLGNESGRLDIGALLSELGIPVIALTLGDEDLDGGCVCDRSHGPAVFVNPRSKRASVPWGKQVVLAHELCHLLFDRRQAVPLGVISGPWAPPRIERVANAFAIELLLPLAGVERVAGRTWDRFTDEHVKELMDEFGLGITAVTEHVRNLADRRNR